MPLSMSSKKAVLEVHCGESEVNDTAGGAGGTTTGFVVVSEKPHPLTTASVTLYVPPAAYMCVGFCNVDVFPSPKSQLQEIGVSVEVSVNCTAVVPAHP
jgi:hypothetical protein